MFYNNPTIPQWWRRGNGEKPQTEQSSGWLDIQNPCQTWTPENIQEVWITTLPYEQRTYMRNVAGDCPGQTCSQHQEHFWVTQVGGRKSCFCLQHINTGIVPYHKALKSRCLSKLTSSSPSSTWRHLCHLSQVSRLPSSQQSWHRGDRHRRVTFKQ